MSSLPSKQAARSGVESVFVLWLTSAPCLTSSFMTFKCPRIKTNVSAGNFSYLFFHT